MNTVNLVRPSIADDLRITPQARRVLAYLQKGKRITPMKAMVELSISRLASCIHEIRKRAGYTVDMEIDQDEVGHKFARYTLRGSVN
jgi:hypothetical protein